MDNKYCLILGAFHRHNYYLAGWLAGSVLAHKIYCDQWGKVFWVCPLKCVGLREDENRLIDKHEFLSSMIEDYGYFYDGKDGAVSWVFNIEGIYTDQKLRSLPNDMFNTYKNFIGFRQKYFDESDDKNYWILISDIRKIKNPFRKSRDHKIAAFKRIIANRTRAITTKDFMIGGAVFSNRYPSACSVETMEYNADVITDIYLKEIFLSRSLDHKLKEQAVQLAFALRLMQENRWSLYIEKSLPNKGRIDLLFDNGNELVAVEVKRSDNDDPAEQLKEYISELRTTIFHNGQKRNIRGMILCGKADHNTKRKAHKYGFAVKEYMLRMDFPPDTSVHQHR